MPAVENSPFLAMTVPDAVSTEAALESPITRDYGRADDAAASWDHFEGQLIEWGCGGTLADEEGIEPPSKDTVQRAIQVAATLARQGCPAPTRVVTDAHGGIVFELQSGKILESVHVHSTGNIEHRVFRNDKLMLREEW